jgi:phage shock protein PspC (stress-responsive transcriptional regulator)
MNTDTMNPEAPAPKSDSQFRDGLGHMPLRRPFHGRMLAGVAEGVADYFGVDAMIIRIAFVVLTLVGGAGIPLYLAGLLLIPDEGNDQSLAGSLIESFQSRSR